VRALAALLLAIACAAQGIELQGEAGGNTHLAGWIASGRRTPDVFISVDPGLVQKLGDKVASSTTFASSELGMGWAGRSNYAYAFEAAAKGEMPLLVALAQPGLRIARMLAGEAREYSFEFMPFPGEGTMNVLKGQGRAILEKAGLKYLN
jgi:hypothetical protein